MANNNKCIAVLGGGFSGLGCISMLKQEGFDVVCFEKTDQIGGTWCYREESVIGVPSIMPTTIINHSKELGAVSDFPPKKEYSNYMRHSELYQYMMDYVTERDLLKHVRFNCEVIKVKRAFDYEDSGKWVVTVKDTVTNNEFQNTYDGVLVCVGHINHPKKTVFPGMENYKGNIMHTHKLKGVADFKDQTVVVAGMGCSGLDAAVEISSVAKQVYLSTRSGAHVINRVGPYGYPIDYLLFRRYITTGLEYLPTSFSSWYLETFYIEPKFSHKLYTVQPKYHVLAKDPVLNDHIASKILSGSVIQKPDIKCFTENGVIFESENTEVKADAVIVATGYEWNVPFLEDGVITSDKDKINLYRCMWPPQLKHPTFAVIGFLLPFGPGFPLGELQCRWAAHVFAGKGKLPPFEDMMKEIDVRHSLNLKRYSPSEKISQRVDYAQYMDEVATELGVKPNLWKLFFTDFWLFVKLMFGPFLSYQYRLEGPHSWAGAREAIMNSDSRVLYPITRKDI